MILRAGLLDDEPIARKILSAYIDRLPEISLAFSLEDPMQLIQTLDKQFINVLFLDVKMPGLDGLTIARMVAERPIQIVLTTAFPQYAVEGFELEATDYLVKPISFERFYKSVERVKQRFSEHEEFIIIKEDRKLIRIRLNDIAYIQAYGDYIRIFTEQEHFLVKDTMANFAKNLPGNFVRVHRSYLISVDWMKYMEGNWVIVLDQKIPVSSSGKELLIAKLRNH